MNYFVWFFTGVILLFANIPTTYAKTVILEAGESYHKEELTIICIQKKRDALIVLTECQFWDDFHNRCLHEKRIYSYGDLECVEKCQHWDKFSEICHFETVCAFYPSAGIFILTICQEFDEFNNICIRTKQIKITTDR